MWICERDIYKNSQTFYRKTEDGEDKIVAPIKISNGRYEIIDILSVSGGYGIIYKAIDKRLMNRQVLIKARRYDNVPGLFSYAVDSSRKKTIEDIRREVKFEVRCLTAFKNLSESRMPNLNSIVCDFSPTLYGPHRASNGELFICDDKEIYEEEPYIVMQMIEGENLGEYVSKGLDNVLKDRGYKSVSQWEIAVLQYGLQLASLLKHFHEPRETKLSGYSKQYFIYQDLKPENIMITDKIFITLLDFGGMTAILVKENGETISNIKNAGKAGVGTFGYKAPELTKGSKALGNLDNRVDMYSFGATLYHLLTCEPLSKVLKDENDIIPVENLKKLGYTDETYNYIKKCLEQDRVNRFEKMDDAKREIFDILKVIKNNSIK
ncbi:protein kinase [Clostridium sp. D43t1_170807_H7]|uniref:protein kinase domain-containing protein n=1 Tax=Clostridium sp. D43t1_170807_H7 TaxID=2787140 RepID=UPI001898F9E2|nr:protein kinase [Clostridium sp. D43t1_170807_H7]